MDDKTKESVKFLINELSQKKYQKLADEAMKLQGAEKVIKCGKYAGGFVPLTVDDMKWNLDIGMNFVTYSVDSAMLFSNMQTVVNSFLKETRSR